MTESGIEMSSGRHGRVYCFFEQPLELKTYPCPDPLKFESPKRTTTLPVAERKLLGLIVNRGSEHILTLNAFPLITCNAYIFSYATYEGTEKVILYHATSSGPHYLPSIAQQIAPETNLADVSIIIATPGSDIHPIHLSEDTYNITTSFSDVMCKLGFTGKIQILYNCSQYCINSLGKHGVQSCTADLVFRKVERQQDIADCRQALEKTRSCLML